MNADAGVIYQEKTEFVHYVQKMKLAMNSTICFHVIILITKENCTLKKSLEINLILWNSRKLCHLKINMIFKNNVDLLSSLCKENSKAIKLDIYCKQYIVYFYTMVAYDVTLTGFFWVFFSNFKVICLTVKITYYDWLIGV